MASWLRPLRRSGRSLNRCHGGASWHAEAGPGLSNCPNHIKQLLPNEPGPEPVIDLEILQVPSCRGADLLAERLETLLAGHVGYRLTRRVVTSQADAERLGMTGSPTLLADGADPFTPPGGQLPSLSCRLYPGDRDGPGQAPSPGQLRAALGC